MTPEPRSLADDLRQRTDADLEWLLANRPDLLVPVPSDLSAVASRATTAPSISRCLDGLDGVGLAAAWVAARSADAVSMPALAQTLMDKAPGLPRPPAEDAVRRLHSLGLLWGSESRLRAVHPLRALVPEAQLAWPPPPWPPAREGAPEGAVRAQAGLAAFLAVDAVREVVDWIDRERPEALRSGGMAVRDLTALAAALHMARETASLWLELAWAGRLIAAQESWLPTERFDRLSLMPTADAWAILARTWRAHPGTSAAPLAGDRQDPVIVEWRRITLELLAEAPGGADADEVLAVANFRRPLGAGAARDAVVRAVVMEAEAIGVCALGALSPAGAALLAAPTRQELSAAIADLLPAEVDTLIIQSDLTVTAPGPLRPADAQVIRRLADAESRGHATVYRITPASIHRGLAAGMTADELVGFLERMTHAPIPQPLRYLIGDAAREPIVGAAVRRAAPPSVASILARDDAALAARTVRALRAAELPEREAGPKAPATLAPARTAVAALRTAIAARRPVWIGYAESDGTTRIQLVDPIRLGDGGLTAFDHGSERVRTFAMARITGIASAQQEEAPQVEGGFDEFDDVAG